MHRRNLFKSALALGVVMGTPGLLLRAATRLKPMRRVRPSDAAWPAPEAWQRLKTAVDGHLLEVSSLFGACNRAPGDASCREAVQNLTNPFYIGDQPGGTQVSGWLNAWQPAPSVYAVAARQPSHVVAAVNFARDNNLRLVVKGGGHSYQGTSNAPDSLLVWTRAMNRIELHDSFVPHGCEGRIQPHAAVSIESGAVWIDAYNAVTTQAGRYVQGGGCTTVGVAGLIQSGGFGSFSKGFGTAASNLLEAEIVTADGRLRTVNACSDPELHWALKGGGGGNWGVVTRVTLKTHLLPENFGGAQGAIKAKSDVAYRRLLARFVDFYADSLFNPHWGEQVSVRPDLVEERFPDRAHLLVVEALTHHGQSEGVIRADGDLLAPVRIAKRLGVKSDEPRQQSPVGNIRLRLDGALDATEILGKGVRLQSNPGHDSPVAAATSFERPV